MAILKVANVHHDQSGFTRTQVSTANTYTIHTAGLERMRIDPSGNVLIGRTTSTVGNGVELDIAGSANAASYLANGVDISPIGQQTIWIPAGAMTPQVTNGAAFGSLETATNDVMAQYLAFDSTTQEFAQFAIQMPKSWNESTVITQVVWAHPTTTTNFGVVWGISGTALSDTNALDTAFGTAQTATDTGGTANTVYISPETSAITIGNTPAAEDYVVFKISRNPANASDTLAVDAYLLGVKIHYTINAGKDD